MSPEGKKGFLIVLCGIDGSGKTLQSKKLFERFQQEGRAARYVEFPRYEGGFFGELIAHYLRGELATDAAAVSPYLASLPFACDRWEFSRTLWEWIGRGEAVVCNRYVSANMAHQGGRIERGMERDAFYSWVERLEYEIFGVPKPRLHLWLDIKPEHALRLIGNKGERSYLQDKEDIHENLKHLRVAKEAYGELAERMPGWVRIGCSGAGGPRTPAEIAARVWEEVERRNFFSEGE